MPEEDHYNTVDSPEERKHVRILPARPPRNDDEDYAESPITFPPRINSPQQLKRTEGITAHKSRYVHECPQTRNDIQKLKPTDLQKPKITSSSTAQDGAFLVRDSSKKIADEPYVLVVFYGNKVYNIKIRYLLESQQYALGTGLWGNAKFDSISDIIKFYKTFPIILIDGKDQSGTQKEQCILTYPVTENDIKHLWFFNPC
ncbi:UNVERIFIED_CONTAM: hypothetical protein FKN15_071090 [Acipenser sinensis]